MSKEKLFSQRQAAAFLGLSNQMLSFWASGQRVGPDLPFQRVGNRCLYKLSDLQAVKDTRKQKRGS